MTPEIAQVVFFATASVMWIVWLVGTRFALSRVRAARPESGGPRDDVEAADVVTGEAVIEGEAEAVSKKLAEQLVTASSAAGGGGVRITERTRERIVFERVRGPSCSTAKGGPALQALDSGLIMLDGEGGRTRVRYAVSVKRLARIMRIATYAVCFGYGGLIVILVPLLLWTFVVKSENEAVRWQVFQTFQMVHGVWPPFLMGALGGRVRRAAAGLLDTLLANVAHIV